MASAATITATRPGLHDGESPPSRSAAHSALVDAILDRVVEQLDLPGLAEKIIDDVATKLASRVTVESLTHAVMHPGEEEALAQKLLERALEGLSRAICSSPLADEHPHGC